jgi:hypothetical protein
VFRGTGGSYNPATVAITGGTITGVTHVRTGNGTEAAPSFSFSSQTGSGFWLLSDSVKVVDRGTDVMLFRSSEGPLVDASMAMCWGNLDTFATTLKLFRDADDTLAQKRGTNAQTWNHYGTEITVGTRYSRLAIKHAVTTLSAVSGATVTATSLIPAKANVLGVNTIVTTALGTGSGTTGYTVGDGSDADRWGAVVGTVAGTDTDGANATADPTGWFTAASNVVITASGGNFDGTGAILVDVAYTITEAD